MDKLKILVAILFPSIMIIIAPFVVGMLHLLAVALLVFHGSDLCVPFLAVGTMLSLWLVAEAKQP